MAFRAKSEKMTASYRTLQATLRSFGTENTALSASKTSIQTKNRRKKPQYCPSGIQKHRTSHTKTSVLSRQNLRTFTWRSPMFRIFRKHCTYRRLASQIRRNTNHFPPYWRHKFPFQDFFCSPFSDNICRENKETLNLRYALRHGFHKIFPPLPGE